MGCHGDQREDFPQRRIKPAIDAAIQRVLAQDLGGTAVVRFDDPQGVRCVVEAPLAEVAAPGGVMPMLRVGA